MTAPNDEGAQGATRALEQAGKDKDAIVIGVGGYLAKDEFKKEYSCFKATAYIDPVLDGTIAANAAMDWIEFGKVPYEEYKKRRTGIWSISFQCNNDRQKQLQRSNGRSG